MPSSWSGGRVAKAAGSLVAVGTGVGGGAACVCAAATAVLKADCAAWVCAGDCEAGWQAARASATTISTGARWLLMCPPFGDEGDPVLLMARCSCPVHSIHGNGALHLIQYMEDAAPMQADAAILLP